MYPISKAFVRSQDGRCAYQTLHTQLLGEEAISTQCAKVENKLAGITLEAGKHRNWNFDKYVITHKKQNTTFDKLLMDHGYKGIEESSKVCLFMQGIKDPTLTPMKSAFFTQQNLTFDSAVTGFHAFLEN